MRLKRWHIVILLVSIYMFTCTGMFIPSFEGYVLNACNDEPVGGAGVWIRVEADFINPVDTVTVGIKEAKVSTDQEGHYKLPFSISWPKWILIFPNSDPLINVYKQGYLSRMLRSNKRAVYIIPDSELSYESMKIQWSGSMHGNPPGFDMRNSSDVFKRFVRYTHNYSVASKIAETPKDYEFLELFCLRVRLTYAEFDKEDHASLKAYLKAEYDDQSRFRRPRLPIDSCINQSTQAIPPDYLLTEEQMSYVFQQPDCGNVKDVLTQRADRTHLE